MMKRMLNKCFGAFLAVALFVGQFDVSLMCRRDFYQPPVPEKLLKK